MEDVLSDGNLNITHYSQYRQNQTSSVIGGVRYVSKAEIYIEAVTLSIIALLGGSHNLLILVAGLTRPKLHRGINILVLNMAAVDFLSNTVVLPLYACAILRGQYPFGNIGCKIEAVVALQDVGVSVLTNFAIAVNRCAMTRSKQSCAHKLTTTKLTRASVIVAWLFPILTCTGPIAFGLIELEYHFSYNACFPLRSYHEIQHIFGYTMFFITCPSSALSLAPLFATLSSGDA